MKALVTGASRGIGRAVAAALLQAGADVALAVRDVNSVQAWLTPAADSGEKNRRCALAVDLLEPAQVEALVPRALAALGGLDVLVNCAGSVKYTPAAALSRSELMQHLELNCAAPFVLARDAALHMAQTGGGAIVNVASTLGVRPAAQTAAYAASKAALISLTQTLAIEFAAGKVRVNAIAPGVVDTDMVRALRDPAAAQQPPELREFALETQLESLRALHLLGRLGTPEEIAEAVLFLIRAQWITGSVLVADGGLLLKA